LVEESRKHVKDDYKKYFNRSTLKKSIMTKYYSAKVDTAFDYFIEKARKIEGYNDKIEKDLKIEFNYLFKRLDNLEKEKLFNNSVKDYINFLNENSIFNIEYDDFIFSRLNYKLKEKRIDIVVNSKRYTLVSNKEGINEKENLFVSKNRTSSIPNILQSLDAYYARKLLKNSIPGIFSIHDAFALRPSQVTKFIIDANALFNLNEEFKFSMKKEKKIEKIFSKFIIL
jgi:hypothetical protein